jgi:putative heme-binding domain-containing protein
VLLKLYSTAEQDALKDVTLSALESFADPKVAATLLETYPKLTPDLKTKARNVLLARPASALAMLRAIDAKRLEKTELTLNQLRQIQRFADKEIDGLVTKHWGRVGGDSSGEKRARISWLNIAISRSKADMVQGKNLYTKTCANCHQLFGEGQKIGPDLTTADRKNRDYLLTHVVDPSVYIRPEYMTQIIRTVDGRTFEGVVVETAGETVTLANSQAQKTTIQKKNIEEMVPSAFSVMPEKLLDTLTDQQVADLFSYLQSEPPKKK